MWHDNGAGGPLALRYGLLPMFSASTNEKTRAGAAARLVAPRLNNSLSLAASLSLSNI